MANAPAPRPVASPVDQAYLNRSPAVDVFQIPFDFNPLAGSGTSLTQVVTIEAGTSFEWFATSFTCFTTAAGATITDGNRLLPNVTVLLRDSGSTRQLMLNPIQLSAFGGIGRELLWLPQPRWFAPQTSLSMTLVNNDTSTLAIQVQFHGVKKLN